MNTRRRLACTFVTLLFWALTLTSVGAQDTPTSADNTYPPNASSGGPASGGQTNTDPPGRVARIQYMSGEVSIQPGGVNDWVAANLNRPLTSADRVWTDKNSKAELNLGGGYLRMNSESSLTLSNVSDNTIQVELDQGTLEVTVRYLNGGEIYEVDTPNAAFTVMKPGVYRFNVYPNEDQTWATVRKGNLEATGRGSAVQIKSGEQVRFTSGNSLQHTAEAAPAPDGFDDWAQVRDKRLDSSQSARYVSPGVVGYEDLDQYGNWSTIAPYGPVWVPNSVPVGWAPYRYGHWVWIAPWGWTWVDDAPWGFAPFHYGRWVNTGGYWGWAPGPYRGWGACYAPALVGWLGGPGFGVGFGFGGPGWGVGVNFGWFPLGWGEPYYPWYGGYRGGYLSRNYIRNVNVSNTHIANVNNITNNYYNHNINNGGRYVNRNVAGAVTAAPQSAIASGQQINRVGRAVPASQLGHAQLMRGIDATPTRAAMLGGENPRNSAVPPRAAGARPVVTRETPPQRPAYSPAAAGNAVHAPATAPVARTAENGHYVPRPPSAGGAPVTHTPEPVTAAREVQPNNPARYGSANTTPAGSPTHNVPRPPTASSGAAPSYGHGSGTANQPPPSQATSNTTRPSAQQRSVSPQYQPAPSSHEGTSHPAPESKPKSGNSDRPQASNNVPQPPSAYTYRPAATQSAANRSYSSGSYGRSSSYNGSGSSSASPAYAANRGSYASAPAYRSGGSGAAPAYAPRQMASAPTARYSAPEVSHYSAPAAPRYSGGGGSYGGAHYSAPSGGGGYHASSGGGGSHASGGGGHHR